MAKFIPTKPQALANLDDAIETAFKVGAKPSEVMGLLKAQVWDKAEATPSAHEGMVLDLIRIRVEEVFNFCIERGM